MNKYIRFKYLVLMLFLLLLCTGVFLLVSQKLLVMLTLNQQHEQIFPSYMCMNSILLLLS